MATRKKYYPVSTKEIDIYKRERDEKETRRNEITNQTLISLRRGWHASINGNKKLEFTLQHFSRIVSSKLRDERHRPQLLDTFRYLMSDFRAEIEEEEE